MNDLIEQAFENFSVPVSFLYYDGDAETYITYQQTDSSGVIAADNKIINYVDYYDVDVFSTGNYLPVIEAVKEIMTNAGFIWQPSRSSGDMFETDTKYYHKTLCFAIERSN